MTLELFTQLESAPSAASSSSSSVPVSKPVLDPDETITFTADRTKLFLHQEKEEGVGTLWITTKHVIWIALDGSTGYRLVYPYILLHAVCRDTSSFPYPCLYAQLDEELDEQEEAFKGSNRFADDDEDEDDQDEDEEASNNTEVVTELRFVPENPDILDALWSSMSSCAALHPDADEGDDDGEGDFLFDATEIENGLRRTGLGEGEDEEDYYQGGENVDAYAHMNSNDARLRALEQRMGVSAAEMYGDDEEEEDEDEEETVDSRIPFNPLKSKSPDEPAVVASQLSKANEQVQAAAAASTTIAPRKREREDGQGDEPADNAGPQIR